MSPEESKHNTEARIPRRRLVAAVLLLVLLVAVLRGCVFRPATAFPGSHFNRGANAAWLGVEWVNEAVDDARVEALGADLVRRQITTIFVYTSYLRLDGEFGPTYSHPAKFVRALHAAQPGIEVQAWIGIPMNTVDWGYVDLNDPVTRRKVADFCGELLRQAPFDGVHLDPEPIPDGHPGVLALLDDVRAAIGPAAKLSLATRHIQPLWAELAIPYTSGLLWHADYYRAVAQRVDQIALMTYDSALPDAALYRQFTRFEVIEASRALDGTDVELFIGLPASEESTATHNPSAETLQAGLQGTVDGLNDAEARAGVVAGVALYPYWEIDAGEWAAYTTMWLGR